MNENSAGSKNVNEAAFAEFHEAWFSGQRLDPEEFIKNHPECGAGLREKIENFLLVDQGISDARIGGSDEAPEEPDLSRDQVLGDFKILREIGSGGMATVYEAEQISLNRKVALKILPTHLTLSDQSVKKFYREAEAGGRQSHPGIVSIYAVGEQSGRHYIAEELVEGGFTLADKLNELRVSQELPIGYFRVIARLIAKTAEAMEHAHASGVIHTDVKPSNILSSKEGDPKVGFEEYTHPRRARADRLRHPLAAKRYAGKTCCSRDAASLSQQRTGGSISWSRRFHSLALSHERLGNQKR